jgi:hypothetical protein
MKYEKPKEDSSPRGFVPEISNFQDIYMKTENEGESSTPRLVSTLLEGLISWLCIK